MEANVLKQIDHIGIAVFNLSEALKKYERLFQVKPKYNLYPLSHLRV